MTMPRNILVPVVGGDLTPTAFADACAALDRAHGRRANQRLDDGPLDDVRLVVLHVADGACGRSPAVVGGVPLWRRLAERVAPQRVFVETACGDAARVIAEEAERFDADVVAPHGGRARVRRARPRDHEAPC